MAVYWLEQAECDVAVEDDWLSLAEAGRLRNMRFPKRRADWRLGRWTAKRALACCLGLTPDPKTLAEIELRPTRWGAPEVFIARRRQTLNLSLSHCSGRAMCAITLSSTPVGCDLEVAEVRHDAFLTDYFTLPEQSLVRNSPQTERWRVLALLWSAKESALKALQIGLRLDTRLAAVDLADAALSDSSWRPFQVSCPNERLFVGFHSGRAEFIRTIVTAPPPQLLIQLRPPVYRPPAARSIPMERMEEMNPVQR
jgi:4'-phosphopantetheinyl transferase